jgi:hypothetical protein
MAARRGEMVDAVMSGFTNEIPVAFDLAILRL